MSGYPTMIDPATGLVWGINPDTGDLFDGIDFPVNYNGDSLNPTYVEDLSIFGESPVTGVSFGIDPNTNEPWRCDIFDINGEIYNPYPTECNI